MAFINNISWLPKVAPSRGRGLKLVYGLGLAAGLVGRPFTGAWIETGLFRRCGRPTGVAPSRGRGLKLDKVEALDQWRGVAPSRGRGLKLC